MSKPMRALAALLLMPVSAFANPGRVVTAPVGEAGVLGGGGFQGARTPTMAPVASFLNPVLSAVTPNQPAFQTLTPTVSNPNVAAAMADPRAQAAMPASAFVAPSGVQAAPDAAAKTATPRQEPGNIPSFDDPARRTPEGGSASGVSTAVKDLDKAKKDEADGKNPGALGVKLDSMFDFAKARGGSVAGDPSLAAAAQLGAPSVAGLPDPKVMGVEPALVKLSVLARAAEPAEAPALYQRAAEVAQAGLPAAQAAARVSAMRAEAAQRAPKAVQALADQSLSAAAQGRTTDAIRYAKGVHGWDAVVGAPGRPYVENLAEFTGTVKHVLAKALSAPGKTTAAPKVRFEASPSARSALPAPVRARFQFAAQTDGPVTALPAVFAESLALPELKGFVALDGPEAPAGPELSEGFSLRAEAGFGSLFRAARAANGSAWSAFWVTARQVVNGEAATFWDQLRAVFVRLLQAAGILHSALPAGPVVQAADPAVLASLRALEPQRVERPALPASPDALGLGYTLVGAR